MLPSKPSASSSLPTGDTETKDFEGVEERFRVVEVQFNEREVVCREPLVRLAILREDENEVFYGGASSRHSGNRRMPTLLQ